MASYGMKLPGKCPNPPATQHLTELTKFTWMFGVPFSQETPSQIFRNIDNSNRQFFKVELFSKVFYLAYNRTGQLVHRRCEDETQNWASDDKQISVTIEEQHVGGLGTNTHTKCSSKLIENVRIWYDNDFTIIWSCVNFNAERERYDEAFLMLWKSNVTSSLFPDINSVFNVSRKYISEGLLAAVNWGVVVSNLSLSDVVEEPYDCPVPANIFRLCCVILTFSFTYGGLVYSWFRTPNEGVMVYIE